MNEREKQRIYEEFVLTYLTVHPRASQIELTTDIRKAFCSNGMPDPGVSELRKTVDRLVTQGKIKGNRPSQLRSLSIVY